MVYRVVFLMLLVSMMQIQVLFAHKISEGEKLIEVFLKELARKEPITDSFIKQYVASDGTKGTNEKIHKGLSLVRTAYLRTQADKTSGLKVEELTIAAAESGTHYYGIRLDKDHSLNFVIQEGKIKSISSYTESSYNTTVFF